MRIAVLLLLLAFGYYIQGQTISIKLKIQKPVSKKSSLSLGHLSKGTYLVIVYYPNHLDKYKQNLE